MPEHSDYRGAERKDSVNTSPPPAVDRESADPFGLLRPHADADAAGLRAWDAADRYLVDTVSTAHDAILADPDARIAVIDDTHGALMVGLAALGVRRATRHHDSVVADRATETNLAALGAVIMSERRPLDTVAEGATLVLLRLPRSLARLDAVARAVARVADPAAVLVAGNMVKHMTPRQNEVLSDVFSRVDVSLARGKARLLTATGPRAGVDRASPAEFRDDELGLTIVAVAGTFAGAAVDVGTRVLLQGLDDLPDARVALDLGCGSGVLATVLATRLPGATVIATDVSAVAVESARLTAAANGVVVEVRHDDGASSLPEASVDLVLLNPPFHVGGAVHTGIAHRLIGEAARVLRPGGELRCVWNSSLQYRPVLEREVGPTRQLERTRTFTVTSSTRTRAGRIP
jgi:16S rRNA (guanine1207-N2)-methyltransferase